MRYKNMVLVGKAQIMANNKKSKRFQDEILMARCELLEARSARRTLVKPERMSEFDIQNHNAIARVLRQNPFMQY